MEATVEQIKVHPGVLEGIKKHAHREANKGGYEAVGFLAGRGEQINTMVPLNNHAANPRTHYFVEPWEQYRAESYLKENDYVIFGSYHSHPHGEALPSKSDTTMARPGELIIIYSVTFGTISAWRERDGQLQEVALNNE